MIKLIKWLRARLFARRWAAMRKSAMYQTDMGAWDYQPQELHDRDSIIGAHWPR